MKLKQTNQCYEDVIQHVCLYDSIRGSSREYNRYFTFFSEKCKYCSAYFEHSLLMYHNNSSLSTPKNLLFYLDSCKFCLSQHRFYKNYDMAALEFTTYFVV